MLSNRLFRTLVASAAVLCAAQTASAQVVISQVWGSGGNSQAMLTNDFIELYNAGATPQNLTGWSTQYASNTGTTWTVTALPAVTLNPGQYLLVQQAAGTSLPTGTVPANPAAQATGTVAMSGTDAKVALVASTTALTGGTPLYSTSPNLRDFVGIGTATWNESAAAGGTFAAANNAPGMNTALAIFRRLGGAGDSNVNRADFAVGYPAPRNTSTTLGAGLAGSGTAFPLTVEENQIVRLLATPFDVTTNRASAGLTVTADLTGIGGSAAAALVDDGTSGDDLAGDGIYTLQTTVAAGTTTGTKNLPVSFADSASKTGGMYLNVVVVPTSTPDNDNCFGAQALTLGTPVSGTYTGALPESNPIATMNTPSAGSHSSRRGLWFSVTGTGNTLTASMCGTTPAVDSVMAVYVGGCDGLTIIGGGDDNGPACTSSTNASFAWCSQLGANYLIWIAPFSTGAQTSAFNLVVTDGGTPCTGALPANVCTGVAGPYTEAEAGFGPATNDGCTSTPFGFTDIATPGFPGLTIRGTGRGMVNSRDVDGYRFQATTTDTIQIVLNTLGTNAQAQLQKLSAGGACPATALTPAANTALFVTRCANGIQTLAAPVVAGDWYVISVIAGVGVQQTPPSTFFGGQMAGGSTYQYELYAEIGAPPTNNACASAIALTTSPVVGNLQNATNDGASSCDAAGKDVWYSFTGGADAGTLNLETCGSATGDTVISVFDACGGTELACNDDNATCTNPLAAKLAFALAANQSVRIRVSEKNSGAGAFTLTWSFVVPPPANDECATATVLAAGSTTAIADTRFATPITATAPASTCQASQSRDVWYLWTSQGAGSVQVDTCGAAQPVSDSVITVYTGSCGSLTQIACDDDTCATPGLGSQLSFTATCSTTYIIRVSQYGTSVPATAWTLNITAPGFIDTDSDGSNDCVDGCPNDPLKVAPGICGCGVADVDTDGDTVLDCLDGCPNDVNKTAPGVCGCGVADTDSDGDLTADCFDGCPNDANKTAPGACGCGVADTDTDGDLTADCNDLCPNDPAKIAPGICGCGVADADSDGDLTADCLDGCPNDANKTAPGACGCGVADTDTDGDGTADCNDLCPNDPLKVAPGTCGCGVADTDTDGDGVADCNDNCDAIANPAQGDCDLDGVGDACEIAAGTQLDTNANGTPDSCELGAVFTYCTAGTTTNGCNASISAVGTPSVSATAGFVVFGSGIEGQRQTLMFYGVNGPAAQVWAPGSSSFKCVRNPLQRVAAQNSGGTTDTCGGTYALDLRNYLANRPTAIGNPLFAGEVFNAQLWFRDPPSPGTSSLSNALQFTMAP